ncbi:MAG TPA: hypothetical protein VH934_24945 [Xanthobacteraceae bacterium]|jgi:hypothetical protein
MIAPAGERAPRMLLIIGEDEQGLPTEVITPELSVSRLIDGLRLWLAAVLPNRLCHALGLLRPNDAVPLAPIRSSLIDVRVRWAGL